MVNKYMYHC